MPQVSQRLRQRGVIVCIINLQEETVEGTLELPLMSVK